MTADFVFADWMIRRKERVNQALANKIADENSAQISASNTLIEAMRYATLNGGKRLRALLVYAVGEALHVDLPLLDIPASAVELIHAYSLVHDDMPMMDDDDLRRGMPTCHKAYGEATALLVGDALQSLAFETLCDDALSHYQTKKMVKILAHHTGLDGMVGGQAIDFESVGKPLDIATLKMMYNMKTGALIRASVALGALLSTVADETVLAELDRYATAIGLAFQIYDDILDVVADTHALGKAQGADSVLNKPTYAALLGIDDARKKAEDLIAQALAELQNLPYDTQILASLARFVVQRSC